MPPPPPPQQQPTQAYQAPFESHTNDGLYDDIYADVGGGSGPPQPAQQLPPQQPQPQQPAPQSAPAAAVGAGSSGAGGGGGQMSQQQILALLQDPARMAALLRSNPSLANMLQAYLPPGFKLPGM